MARGSSARGSAHGTPSSLTSLLAPTVVQQPLVVPITEVQAVGLNQLGIDFDGREYHPARRIQSPGSFVRSAGRLLSGRSKKFLGPERFAVPNLVSVCIRRKMRREVLHAFNKTRSGRGGGRRRNKWSSIKC